MEKAGASWLIRSHLLVERSRHCFFNEFGKGVGILYPSWCKHGSSIGIEDDDGRRGRGEDLRSEGFRELAGEFWSC